MVLGRLKREQQAMLNNSTTPPPEQSFGEAMKAIAAFANSPDAVKKQLTKLAAQIEAAEKAEATAKIERQNLADETRAAAQRLDDDTKKHHAVRDKLDAERGARNLARENAVEAREKAVTKREAEAEALLAKAKEAHAAVRAQIDAFDRAATVRVPV
jgi:type VI protein secretion system component VasK